MLITSRFVVLNFPKTGSSFVRAVLKSIHRRRRWRLHPERHARELMLPSLQGTGNRFDQHGTLRQVPARYRHLPLVSVMRNPYDRLLSMYEFNWWKTNLPLPQPELREMLPHFPDLSLDDFVLMSERIAERTLGGRNPLGIGRQTIQFIRFFFADPERTFAALSDDYVASGAFRADMGAITFLRQERLNDELADFLARHDYSEQEVARCRTAPRVNRTEGGVADRTALWTDRAAASVARSERYLLDMLAQLGFVYAPPPSAAAHLPAGDRPAISNM